MSKAQFWIRFAIWVSLAVVVPFVYIAVEFGLFTETTGKSLSGWGLVAIVFASIMMLVILGQTKNSMPKGSMFRQCIGGFMALIPLLAVILFIERMKSSMDAFERFLIVVLACEAVAVPINPLPKWAQEHNIELFSGTLTDAISKALKSSKEAEKKD